jgi:hypothetical protein
LKGHVVAKKPTKAVFPKPAAKKPATAAKVDAPQAAAPAQAPAKPKAPPVPPRPVPAHQQFLSKGVKPQSTMKARIIRHQGR